MLFTQTLLFASLLLSILASPLHFKRQDSISAQGQATSTLSTQAAVATPARTAIPVEGGGAQPQDSTPTSTEDDASQDDTEDPEQDVSNDSSPQEVQDASDYSPDYTSSPDNAQVAAGDPPSTPFDDSSTPSNETADDASTPDSSTPSDSTSPETSSPDDPASPDDSSSDSSTSDSTSPDGMTGTDGAGNDNDDNYFAGDDWFNGTK